MKISIKIFCVLYLIIPFLSLNPRSEVFFSPDDSPTKRLIEIINTTKKRVYAAVYMLTDKQIAAALVSAKQRGVDVKIIIDKATADYEYGKSKVLQEAGIDVYVFADDSKNKKFGALMHNKFAILDEKIWTGSFNWTKSANQKNQENVILTTNKKVCQKFEEHFEILKKRCFLNKGSHRKPKNNNYDSEKTFWEKLKELIMQFPVSKQI
ncbi:MAG: Phospholipase D/Transphosphatidylase [candidate division TM6 bacterium GW2011_GWF2_37_49]|nr:MAG: Phospholipase D/Transphosphatidylase [candidate division TM6 bacterium GW2011_GWF2_37_49]